MYASHRGVEWLSTRLIYLQAGPSAAPQRVKKSDVLARLERGVWINVMGLGATLLGLQVRAQLDSISRPVSLVASCLAAAL